MRTALIGHRGTGKTSLLERIQTYYREAERDVLGLDLDQEIELKVGKTIIEIFSSEGEEAFRQQERSVFESIDTQTKSLEHDVFVVMGAGFDPSLIPSSWRVLWIRRSSDIEGRIFLDRPRLNSGLTSLEEFRERYGRRTAAYRARADEVLWLDEGLDRTDSAERKFFLNALSDLGGCLTLKPEHFRTETSFNRWLRRRLEWGIRWFELRDDLLSPEQMEAAIRSLPDDRILVSFRKVERRASTAHLIRSGLAYDWPLEMGSCPYGEPRFLSLHERREGQSLTDALSRFPIEVPEDTQFKAALPVRDFGELMEGHRWCESHSEARIFLPHSPDGRWSWYRLLRGTRMGLNFIREGDGSGADQPTLLQWARRRSIETDPMATGQDQRFAAVLGDPVSHSRTPMEQKAFFGAAGISVFAVRLTQEEWRAGALTSLSKLGLRWAAVTSPLKELAFEACSGADGSHDEKGEELGAVNTMQWLEDSGQWVGTNTDLEGFSVAVTDASSAGEGAPLGRIAVWGGGGTLNVVKAVLPEAQFFSLRTGENRDAQGPKGESFDPQTVIWAVSAAQGKVGVPPQSWKASLVLDLNYAENSPGRTYALDSGCRYVSGLAMFRAQASGQRRFWEIR